MPPINETKSHVTGANLARPKEEGGSGLATGRPLAMYVFAPAPAMYVFAPAPLLGALRAVVTGSWRSRAALKGVGWIRSECRARGHALAALPQQPGTRRTPGEARTRVRVGPTTECAGARARVSGRPRASRRAVFRAQPGLPERRPGRAAGVGRAVGRTVARAGPQPGPSVGRAGPARASAVPRLY